MIEAGRERGFLAEIARQRDHLEIDGAGRQRPSDRQGGVAAAVVHIYNFHHEAAGLAQAPRHLDDAAMERHEPGRLVIERNHDRKAGLRPGARPGRSLSPACETDRIGRHCACLSSRLGPTSSIIAQAGPAVAPRPLCILPHLHNRKEEVNLMAGTC